MTSIPLETLPLTHLTQRDADVLARLAGSLANGGTAVEIGSYLGASSLCIARSFPGAECRLFCVDTWTNLGMTEGPRDTFAEFLRNTEGLRSSIQPLRMDSVAAARDFARPVDFIFIDGDHSFEGCRRDILAWLPTLRDGAIVALHDFAWADGVREAVRDFILPAQSGSGHWEGNIYWTRTRQPHPTAAPAVGRPTATIVVPTGGKAQQFQPASLNLAEISGAKECLVVYTGLENAPEAGSRSRGIQEIAEREPGLLAGRHRAFHEATGEILIYLDDDVRLESGWLEAMLEPFSDPSVHLVGCRYLPEYESPPPEWMESLWSTDAHGRHLGSLSLLDYGTGTFEIDPVMIWGLCYAIRKDTLQKLGGFHPDGYPWELRRFRGDGETAPSALARQLKLKAIYQGKAAVYHQVPNSRMTSEYFERRAHLQGISDSYAMIRAERKLQPQSPLWRRSLRRARRIAGALRRSLSPATPASTMPERLARAHREGFSLHQEAVRSDPALLSWVLREDYWDYRLPRT